MISTDTDMQADDTMRKNLSEKGEGIETSTYPVL